MRRMMANPAAPVDSPITSVFAAEHDRIVSLFLFPRRCYIAAEAVSRLSDWSWTRHTTRCR